MRVIEIPGLFHSPISTSPSPSFLPVVKLSGGGGGGGGGGVGGGGEKKGERRCRHI